jgi:hypothetical protein
MKKTGILFLFMFTTLIIAAQTNFVIVGKQYSPVRITPRHGGVFKANNFKLINDTLAQFTRHNSVSSELLNISSINIIEGKKGTKALKYGLIGSVVGLTFVGIAIATANSDPDYVKSDEKVAPLAIGATLGFATVGAVVGAFIPTWKILTIKHISSTTSVSVTPGINNKYCYAHIVLNF